MESKPWFLSKTLVLQVVSVVSGLAVTQGWITAEQAVAITAFAVPVLTFIDRMFFSKKTLTA